MGQLEPSYISVLGLTVLCTILPRIKHLKLTKFGGLNTHTGTTVGNKAAVAAS